MKSPKSNPLLPGYYFEIYCCVDLRNELIRREVYGQERRWRTLRVRVSVRVRVRVRVMDVGDA